MPADLITDQNPQTHHCLANSHNAALTAALMSWAIMNSRCPAVLPCSTAYCVRQLAVFTSLLFAGCMYSAEHTQVLRSDETQKTGSREMATNHQGSRATVHLNAGSWEHRAVTVAPPYECPARATASTSSFPTHRKHRSKSKLLCNC